MFDESGRAVAQVVALGHRSTAVYDAASRAVASVDALANRWSRVAGLKPLERTPEF